MQGPYLVVLGKRCENYIGSRKRISLFFSSFALVESMTNLWSRGEEGGDGGRRRGGEILQLS